MKITIENYHQCSRGNFTTCPVPEGEPDYQSRESKYWHLKSGDKDMVVRSSNHWGHMINCYWTLDNESPRGTDYLTGFVLTKDLQLNLAAIKRIKKLFLKLPDEIQLKLMLDLIRNMPVNEIETYPSPVVIN